MSGSAAGDWLLVVRPRQVSWIVFMATSPALGSIQWNPALMVPSVGLGSESILTNER